MADESLKTEVLREEIKGGDVMPLLSVWRDISTAPKDEWIIGRCGLVVCTMMREDDGEGFYTFNMMFERIWENNKHLKTIEWKPTHWSPLHNYQNDNFMKDKIMGILKTYPMSFSKTVREGSNGLRNSDDIADLIINAMQKV